MRLKFKNKEEWHYWFAWHPIFIGDTIVWLEMVRRRRYRSYDDYASYYLRWEYDNLTSDTD
jgi:hypothetical protein